jgi:hypothetical protein
MCFGNCDSGHPGQPIEGGVAAMSHSKIKSNVKSAERRKHWNDRRKTADRRNQERLNHMGEDCRNNIPRRESDIIGTFVEGELWWSGDRRFV